MVLIEVKRQSSFFQKIRRLWRCSNSKNETKLKWNKKWMEKTFKKFACFRHRQRFVLPRQQSIEYANICIFLSFARFCCFVSLLNYAFSSSRWSNLLVFLSWKFNSWFSCHSTQFKLNLFKYPIPLDVRQIPVSLYQCCLHSYRQRYIDTMDDTPITLPLRPPLLWKMAFKIPR